VRLKAGLPARAQVFEWTPVAGKNLCLDLLGLADGFIS